MPEDDAQQRPANAANEPTTASTWSRWDWKNVFSLPKPLKDLFQKFPLVAYDANTHPLRAPKNRDSNVLYVFTTEESAAEGAPSFNPSCLKWQTYLKFRGIPFTTVASNNHASPSGALPFLIPKRTSGAETTKPVAGNKLERWAENVSKQEDKKKSENVREITHMALLEHNIRRAWLYQLYIHPGNFTAVAERIYVDTVSSNIFVRLAIARQLRSAALEELQKISPRLEPDDILSDGKEAFNALSALLGGDKWFFGADGPGLFDAAVFAYTYLLLDEGMGWQNNDLGNEVRGFANLVDHRDRIVRTNF